MCPARKINEEEQYGKCGKLKCRVGQKSKWKYIEIQMYYLLKSNKWLWTTSLTFWMPRASNLRNKNKQLNRNCPNILFVRPMNFENTDCVEKEGDTILHYFATLFNVYKSGFSGLFSRCTISMVLHKFWKYKKSPVCPFYHCYCNVLIFVPL